MHIVDDQVETIHVYMVPEKEKRPYTVLLLLVACLCLLAIASLAVYSGEHPAYEHQTLTIPARFLPPQTFTAAQTIIPTGVKTYPATTAQGTLTITNGSVIAQTLPAGLILTINSNVSVVTDQAVYVPAGSVDGYGVATVEAHLSTSGVNLSTLAINQVLGTSLYVRNLQPFTGGHPAYSVKYATAQDKQTALLQARGILLGKSIGLHSPCMEEFLGTSLKITVTWHCRFVQSPHVNIPNARITGIRLLGKKLIVDVMFIALPQRYWAK